MQIKSIAIGISLLASGAAAQDNFQGDPQRGEQQFKRQCTACHVVADPSGQVLAGRTARVGPNLFGLAGRKAGSVDGYRYSKALVAANDAGVAWNEENFVGFVQNPTQWLQDITGDRARSRMSYMVRAENQAYDLYAYLAQFSE